mmetsp:Transcript_44156/g.79430  ORF Transcript_44156/g.79430 Transcript_44156/m.79430 type:complete len:113 (+) Transcript_44156:633-971(+)
MMPPLMQCIRARTWMATGPVGGDHQARTGWRLPDTQNHQPGASAQRREGRQGADRPAVMAVDVANKATNFVRTMLGKGASLARAVVGATGSLRHLSTIGNASSSMIHVCDIV